MFDDDLLKDFFYKDNKYVFSFYNKFLKSYISIYFYKDYLVKLDFKNSVNSSNLNRNIVANCQNQLEEYLYGSRKTFEIKYILKTNGDFSKKVLENVKKIKYGDTSTYGQIAINIKNPKSYRAVGNSISHNPLPIIIPCHRVIRSDNLIGNYLGGKIIKNKLLLIEKNYK